LKPDRAIFHLAKEKFSVDPRYTLFVDDKIENVESAIQAGFQGVQFKDNKTFLAHL
jgi:2-haloacid dehalogenase